MKKFFVVLFLLVMMSTVVYGASFGDIEGLACENAVESIAHLGIVNGVGENLYAPEKLVTRAELSKMIVSAIGNETGAGSRTFSDVNNHWGKDFVLKAASLGILNGYDDGTFKPDREVTYAEAVTIMIRCLGYNDLDESTSNKWYDNYILKMDEIKLNNGVQSFSPDAFANRGDVAMLLWNMIRYEENNKSMLDKNFSEYTYWENVKIKDITAYAGRIVYDTSKGAFYMDENVDFSDLGAKVSGFYDKGSNILYGMKIDDGLNLKKISGSTKTIKEMGYDTFECNDISGYGEKEHAEYIEIFVDEETDETVRVVYYDTRESHFAEEVKIGKTNVTIESKDVYDQSIVMLDNGQKIVYNILRTESVKDIPLSALLVYQGKCVEWDSMPNNSVLREIKKNTIYTYTHEYIDGAIDEKRAYTNKIKFDGTEYIVAEDCICENVETNTSMKLVEGLTNKDLSEIAANEDNSRIYLNEFNEIVKLEFSYDIWNMKKAKEQEEKIKDLQPQLARIGVISEIYWYDGEYDYSIRTLPKKSAKSYYSTKKEFKVGDFVYFKSGESNTLVKLSGNTKFDGMQAIVNYKYPFEDDKIGIYEINEQTEIIEVKLKRDREKAGEYSDFDMATVSVSDLDDYENYKSINLLVDDDGAVIRVYAIKEYGNTFKIGIISNMVEDTEKNSDGEDETITKVYVTNSNDSLKRYRTSFVTGYSSGDMVIYEVKNRTDEEKEDTLIVKEVYKHELIGNEHDLIVAKNSTGKVTFKNSDEIIDFSKDTFIFAGEEYRKEDYTFVKAQVVKNKETGEWIFKNISITEKINITAGSRLVINELSRTVVIYTGYRE